VTLDAYNGVSLALMGNVAGDQGTGIGAYLNSGTGYNNTIMKFFANGASVASIYGPDASTAFSGDLGTFNVNGTLSSQDMLIANAYNGASSTVLIRTCDGGAFDTAGTTHNISIQGAILKQNAAFFGGSSVLGPSGSVYNNIMGTLYVSATNLLTTSGAKAGHATISVLKLAGASEMDVMPISVHQSANMTTFSVGKTSDNLNVAIQTDLDCAITWQFYGSAF